MKYDFTSIMDRQGRDALAIDSVGRGHAPGAPREGFDVIPMWIADMNFPTIPTVPAAMGTFSPRMHTSTLSSAGRSTATA